ncbi:MAG TPA: phosphatase PAP2 family protein [Allosphingosinicella sp.]|nr:phosphatase PAP2 family protein [Allosphingosinicella sp.]
MEARRLWLAAALFALLAAAGAFGLDATVARWTAGGADGSFWDIGTRWLDLLTLKEISNFLLGALLLLAAAGLLAVSRTRTLGWPLLYLGLVQSVSTVAADLSKPQLGRLRPFEAAAPGGADTWFVGANSFPSGHVAFYAGLFLPLTVLVPRWTAAWLLPPLFIAAARMLENDHYLSDVAASLALAAALAAALAPLAHRARSGTVEARGRAGL